MKRCQACFVCLAALLIAPFVSRAADPKPAAAVIVRLDDVQGLWGGQTLVLDAEGNLFVRKVAPKRGGLNEQRYHLKLPPDELSALLTFIPASGILDYRERKRSGVPDEAYPRITLTLPNQKEFAANKWANDKSPNFDKLYARLLLLVERATQTRAYKNQKHDSLSKFPGDG